jgi:hypothetical protein
VILFVVAQGAPRTGGATVEHEDIYDEARQWLLDCYPDEDDQTEIEGLTDDELLAAVDRDYEGGWAAFLEAL